MQPVIVFGEVAVKCLFICILAGLIAASIVTAWMIPELLHDVPVIYWATDPNPARTEQIAIFQRWLKKDSSRPECKLLLDTANNSSEKLVIQGVSNVAADVIDIYGGAYCRFYNSVGMIADMTEAAKRLGFDPNNTYRALSADITVDSRQYMFPCNAYALMYWINRKTFARYGIEIPPGRMDIETFERIGRELVDRANPASGRRTVFFCDAIDIRILRRSMGVSVYNETLSASDLDDPGNVRAYKLWYKWTHQDHLMPTRGERESFTTGTGYGGSTMQLFNTGNYAMFLMGRYALIQLRQFEGLELAVCEPPHGGFANTVTGTRAAAVYKGSEHPDCAYQFLAYLASKDYNMQIVRDADALPPNPKWTRTEAFLRPLPLLPNLKRFFDYGDEQAEQVADFTRRFYQVTDNLDRSIMLNAMAKNDLPGFARTLPAPPRPEHMSEDAYQDKLNQLHHAYAEVIPHYHMEWGCHEAFSEAAENIAITEVYSPFIIPQTASRIQSEAEEGFLAGLWSAEEAARQAAEGIDDEIARTLKEKPQLAPLYDEMLVLQKKIDAKKAAGEKIPRSWIKNHFYRRYYAAQNLLE